MIQGLMTHVITMVILLVNPFAGLIGSDINAVFKNMIDALLDDGSCSRNCTVIYKGTKYTACVNCLYDAIGKKSSNRYRSGGPMKFSNGTLCPMCNGRGKIVSQSTENVDLMVLFDSREWIRTAQANSIIPRAVQSPDQFAQTICKAELLNVMKRASEILLDIDTAVYVTNRFVRVGEPEGCGLTDTDYVVTMWQKSG